MHLGFIQEVHAFRDDWIIVWSDNINSEMYRRDTITNIINPISEEVGAEFQLLYDNGLIEHEVLI